VKSAKQKINSPKPLEVENQFSATPPWKKPFGEAFSDNIILEEF
jgi:hypothetical protein